MIEHWSDALVPLAGGVALGLLYFGGLWWTVGSLARTRRPWLVLGTSFMVRAVLAVGGILLVSRGRVVGIAGTLIGFGIGRLIWVRSIGGFRDEERALGADGTLDGRWR